AEGMAADDDRPGPAGDEPRHVAADDRLTEDGAVEDVADGAVGRLPHLLHPRLVGGDGRAFDPDAMRLYGVGGVDRDLVLGPVAALDPEVVVEQLDVEIGQDQLLLDEAPDDARHLVAVELDDRLGNLDLPHGVLVPFGAADHSRWGPNTKDAPAARRASAAAPRRRSRPAPRSSRRPCR